FFHFVMGGGTPAALAADWLASALDQIAFNWISSPLAMRLEQIAVGWLKELFRLPAAWSGVLTTGATTANFTGLAAARRWWRRQPTSPPSTARGYTSTARSGSSPRCRRRRASSWRGSSAPTPSPSTGTNG